MTSKATDLRQTYRHTNDHTQNATGKPHLILRLPQGMQTLQKLFTKKTKCELNFSRIGAISYIKQSFTNLAKRKQAYLRKLQTQHHKNCLNTCAHTSGLKIFVYSCLDILILSSAYPDSIEKEFSEIVKGRERVAH